MDKRIWDIFFALAKEASCLALVSFVLCISSCKDAGDTNYSVLRMKEDISLVNEVNIDSLGLPIGCYYGLNVWRDSILFLMNHCDLDNQYISLFGFDGRPIGKYGQLGKGPEEFISMPFWVEGSTDSLLYISEIHGALNTIRYDAERGVFEKVKNEALISGSGTRGLSMLDDRLYGVNTSQGEGLMFIQTKSLDGGLGQGNLNWIAYPASIVLESSEKANFSLLSENCFSVNKDKKRLVSGMRFFNKILFYDLDGHIMQEVDYFPPNTEKEKIC